MAAESRHHRPPAGRIKDRVRRLLGGVEIENRRFMGIMAMGGVLLILWGAVFETYFALRIPLNIVAAALCFAGSASMFSARARAHSQLVYFVVSLICLVHHLYLMELNDYHPYFLVSSMLAFSLAVMPMSGLAYMAGVVLIPILILGVVCLLQPSELRLLMLMGISSISAMVLYLGYERRKLNDKNRADQLLLEAHRAQAIETAKMAALGEMAGGVSHEINNPLMIITAKAEVMELKHANGELTEAELLDGLQAIRKTVDRIVRIIRGLKTFARDATHDPMEPVRVDQLIAETLDFCEARFKKDGVRLVVDSPPESLVVRCRATQVSQVLLNLLLNARDAVSELEDRWVRVHTDVKEGFLLIRVIDSGRGVPPQLQDKIFQPFFTTKPVGKGTGLGLSVSRGILESHRGYLRINAANPHTEFTIWLPLDEVNEGSPRRAPVRVA